MTPERRRVAVLGGTFDPVHAGHVALATQVAAAIGAGETWLVPARTPALRAQPVAPPHLRLAMLEAAARDLAGVRVLDLELRRPGASYTADTLDSLAATHPGTQPWWVLGADAAREIRRWHRSADLLATAHLAIVQRHGAAPFDAAEARALGLDMERTAVLAIMPPPVSASEVRRRVAAGEAITGLVPPAVIDIISATGLYRSAPAMHNGRG